jgi:Ferredoxin-dependent bilin reductase
MSKVWDTFIDIQHLLESEFKRTGVEIFEPGMDRFNQPGWVNRVWTGFKYRRARIAVVDAREAKGIWIMNCCIFPHIHNPAPIYGFIVVAGRDKITGCWHDFSPAGDKNHPMIRWFGEEVGKLAWRKEGELPDWAQRIFTEHLISAVNVQGEEKLEQLCETAKNTLAFYLEEVDKTNNTVADTTFEQNYYAQNQKQSPATPRVLVSLGLNEDDVRVFIQTFLFPEIKVNT